MNSQCLKCGSGRISEGSLETAGRGSYSIRFCPEGLRRWTLALFRGTPLDEKAFACLDCGLVWGSTSAEDLAAFISEHCDKPPAEQDEA